jgi:capsid protein
LSDVISEQGMDIDEVFDRLSREKALAEKYGLELPVLFGEKDNAKIN